MPRIMRVLLAPLFMAVAANGHPAKIYGKVFEDTNCNMKLDDEDEGLKGVNVVVTFANAKTLTLTTDDNGEYYFETLTVGTTTIDVNDNDIPYGWTQTVGSDPTTLDVEYEREYWVYHGYCRPEEPFCAVYIEKTCCVPPPIPYDVGSGSDGDFGGRSKMDNDADACSQGPFQPYCSIPPLLPPPPPPPPPPGCVNKVKALRLTLVGGPCDVSNPQSNKAKCVGQAVPFDDCTLVDVVVTKDRDKVKRTISGNTVTFFGEKKGRTEELGSTTAFDASFRNGRKELHQSLEIHTSCSQELNVGDRYGAFRVDFIEDEGLGPVMPPPPPPPPPPKEMVVYQYVVTVDPDTACSPGFDRRSCYVCPRCTYLGCDPEEICAPSDAGRVKVKVTVTDVAGKGVLDFFTVWMLSGESRKFFRTRTIDRTVTNTATATVYLYEKMKYPHDGSHSNDLTQVCESSDEDTVTVYVESELDDYSSDGYPIVSLPSDEYPSNSNPSDTVPSDGSEWRNDYPGDSDASDGKPSDGYPIDYPEHHERDHAPQKKGGTGSGR